MTPLNQSIVQLDFIREQYKFNGVFRALNTYVTPSPLVGPPFTNPIVVDSEGLLIWSEHPSEGPNYHGAACRQADIMEAIRTTYVASPNILAILRVKINIAPIRSSGYPYTPFLGYVLLGNVSQYTLFNDFVIGAYGNLDAEPPLANGFWCSFSSGDGLGLSFASGPASSDFVNGAIIQIATYYTNGQIFSSVNGGSIFQQAAVLVNDLPTASVDEQFIFEDDNLASLDNQKRHVQSFGMWNLVIDPENDLPNYSDLSFDPFLPPPRRVISTTLQRTVTRPPVMSQGIMRRVSSSENQRITEEPDE